MAFRAVLFFASAVFIQSIAGQACGRITIPQPPCGYSTTVSNNGGSLIVTSVGPISPSGISVASDLDLCGNLDINGALPFLSGVEFSTTLPTAGTGQVNYGCGDGNIAITQELGNPLGNRACNSGLSASSLGCLCN